MSSEIEETACPEFQRLRGCDLAYPMGHLVASNGTESVIIPENTNDFPNIYKYNVANDQWTHVMSLEEERWIPGAVFDPNTSTLYLSINHEDEQGNTKCDLQAIDTEKWAVRKCLQFSKFGNIMTDDYHILLIGDGIHCLYDDDVYGDDDGCCLHFVLDKVSGDGIQEPLEIHSNLLTVGKPMFLESRNSIVAASRCTIGGSTIVEYSLTTKQWKVWEWAQECLQGYLGFYGSFVSVLNGRCILSFGGWRNNKVSDSIMIYDVDRKQCVESELKLPVTCEHCQTVLLTDKNSGELLTFGFIKRCYKAEEFRNMVILPTSLITLIGKCFTMEFVHLIMTGSKESTHHRVNVDVILKCVAIS